MAWNLEVHQIDVGNGESSLIIASDGETTQTMLIDGGPASSAQTVHRYVKNQLRLLKVQQLDVIVASDFSDGHLDGLENILIADTSYQQAVLVGSAAAQGADSEASPSLGVEDQLVAAGRSDWSGMFGRKSSCCECRDS